MREEDSEPKDRDNRRTGKGYLSPSEDSAGVAIEAISPPTVLWTE
jgi:hypothetical protein